MPTPKQPVNAKQSPPVTPMAQMPKVRVVPFDELWDVTTDPTKLDPLSRAVLGSLDTPDDNTSLALLTMRARHLAFAVSRSASDTLPNRALILRFFTNTAGAPEAVASIGTED